MSTVPRRLHVCGYSARAAVQAAVRCGFECEGWDCFGDRDAISLARWNRIDGLRRDDVRDLLTRPPGVVLPCGGLENRGSLWTRLSERHRLIGPDRHQLRKLRDPRWLSGFCSPADSSMRFPECCFDRRNFVDWLRFLRGRESSGRCLVKRVHSGGGVGVRAFGTDDLTTRASFAIERGEYLQRFVAGDEYSVVFQCCQTPKLLFASRPFPEGTGSHPRFIYRGSIGPVTLPPQAAAACHAFASQISAAIGYEGVLQFDLIVAMADAQPYLLEVNPRWSGSMELAELLSPGSILEEMMAGEFDPRSEDREGRGSNVRGAAAKAILYADADFVIDEGLSDLMMAAVLPRGNQRFDPSQQRFSLADVPVVDARATAGSPICTVIGIGSAEDLPREFEREVDRWRAAIDEAKKRFADGTI